MKEKTKGIFIGVIIIGIILIVTHFLLFDNSSMQEYSLINESGRTIGENTYTYYSFLMYYDGYVDIFFSSSEKVDLYLVKESDFEDYKDNLEFVYVDSSAGSINYKLTDYPLKKENYFLIIENNNKEDITFDLKIKNRFDTKDLPTG